jgi:hypothetical protein
MHKLALALAVAAAVVIPGSWYVSSARADGGYHGYHHHHWRHHHHVWGDGDYEIVRWSNGDCKIWHDDDGPPVGTDWTVLHDNLPTWDAAWGVLVWMQQHHRCT